jgi:hypothetical protein
MLNDYFEFDISEHLISALINSDYSGLNSEEEKLLDDFVSQYSDYKNATYEIVEGEPRFIDCDVTGLFSNCHEVRLHFFNPEIVDYPHLQSV